MTRVQGTGAQPSTLSSSSKTQENKSAATSPRWLESRGFGSPARVMAELLGDYRENGGDLTAAFHAGRRGQVNLAALGRIGGKQVERRLFGEGAGEQAVTRLRELAFAAFADKVNGRVLELVEDAQRAVDCLIAEPEARRTLWAALPGEGQRTQALRQLGVRPELATELSRSRGADVDEAMSAVLAQAKKDLSAARWFVKTSLGYPERMLGVADSFPAAVQDSKRELEIEPGSFADQAITAAFKDGKRTQTIDKALRTAAGIACGIVLGTFGHVAYGLAGKTPLKIPDLVTAQNKLGRAVVAEGVGLAPQGSAEAARKNRGRTIVRSLMEIGASAAIGQAVKMVADLPVVINATKIRFDEIDMKLMQTVVKQGVMQVVKATGFGLKNVTAEQCAAEAAGNRRGEVR